MSTLALVNGAGSHVRRSGPTAGDVLRAVIRTTGELSITLGVLLLLFVVWQLWWTDLESNREQGRLTEQLVDQWAVGTGAAAALPAEPAPATVTGESPAVPAVPVAAPPLPGSAFALVRIPRFGDNYARPVVAGTTTEDLKQGVGHYAGTALPGQIGNFAMAGHRTTYGAPFSRIDELQPGDPVVLQTAEGYYVYRVMSFLIVTPDRIDVIAPVPERPGEIPTQAVMTMTSCHPKYSARQRYVVYGELESFQSTGAGPPAVLASALEGQVM